MKNIGLLVTKNEERIVREVLSKNERFVDAIYALDGSTDRTPAIIKEFSKLKLMLLEKDLHIRAVDGSRQYLLDEIRRREGYGNWITLLHGDEIFYHSPLKVIQAAEAEAADGVVWYAMHFFLHASDRARWDRLKNLPVEERVTHYGINEVPWTEFRQFKFQEGVEYSRERHSRCEPNGIRKLLSRRPIYKHYKVYCREQFAIYRAKWGGLPFIPLNPEEEIFMETLPGYEYALKFSGSFGKFEGGLESLK